MDQFVYRNGELFCENVPAREIAEKFGTPVYVYSRNTIVDHYRQIASAFAAAKPTICFSIKSCGNINIFLT